MDTSYYLLIEGPSQNLQYQLSNIITPRVVDEGALVADGLHGRRAGHVLLHLHVVEAGFAKTDARTHPVTAGPLVVHHPPAALPGVLGAHPALPPLPEEGQLVALDHDANRPLEPVRELAIRVQRHGGCQRRVREREEILAIRHGGLPLDYCTLHTHQTDVRLEGHQTPAAFVVIAQTQAEGVAIAFHRELEIPTLDRKLRGTHNGTEEGMGHRKDVGALRAERPPEIQALAGEQTETRHPIAGIGTETALADQIDPAEILLAAPFEQHAAHVVRRMEGLGHCVQLAEGRVVEARDEGRVGPRHDMFKAGHGSHARSHQLSCCNRQMGATRETGRRCYSRCLARAEITQSHTLQAILNVNIILQY